MTGFEDFFFFEVDLGCMFLLVFDWLAVNFLCDGLVYHPWFSLDILHASAVDHLTDCLPMYLVVKHGFL